MRLIIKTRAGAPSGMWPRTSASLSSPRNKKRKNEYYFRSTDTTTYSSQRTSWVNLYGALLRLNMMTEGDVDGGVGKAALGGSVPCCVYECSCSFFSQNNQINRRSKTLRGSNNSIFLFNVSWCNYSGLVAASQLQAHRVAVCVVCRVLGGIIDAVLQCHYVVPHVVCVNS